MTTLANLETVKSYWDARPCNIRHSGKPVGTREYFDEVEARKYFVEPHIPKFAEFPKWEGKTVLEIGCGIGTDATNFARAGAIYTGVELSTDSLNLTRTRFEVFGLEGKLLEANAEELDKVLPGQVFDLIYSFGVIHHTPSIENALEQIRKLCHGESNVKVMVYAKNSIKNAFIEDGLDQPEAQFGCPIANTYEVGEIIDLFAVAGLKVTNVSQDHIFPFQIAPYQKFEYVRQEWIDAMPAKAFSSLEKHFGWHLLIDAKPF